MPVVVARKALSSRAVASFWPGSALPVHRAFRAFPDDGGAISGRSRRISEKGQIMTAFNAVRFKVKAGREQQFLDAHNKVAFAWPGLRHVNIIKTGEHTFCVIAEWTDMDAIVNARDRMIATLDSSATPLKTLAAGSASPTRFPAQW
jgi:hypothetical protein